jgi:integrase/recombinase XerD
MATETELVAVAEGAALALPSGGLAGDVERLLATWLSTTDSPATRRAYASAVREALAGVGGLAACADPEALGAWRKALMARLDAGELSPGSVALRLAALRGFLRFARLAGALAVSEEAIKRLLKSPRATVIKPYNVLSEDEAGRMLEAARRPRDRAMLALLLGTGLRAAEIVKLQVGDLHIDADGDLILHVRAGKGRKDRLVPVPRGAAAEIMRYLALRGLEVGDARDAGAVIFPSREGDNRGMTTARLRQIVDELLRTAGISKALSPHSMRHTYAATLIRRGAPTPAVQKLLGHASLATTQKYIDHLDLAELKRAVGLTGGEG